MKLLLKRAMNFLIISALCASLMAQMASAYSSEFTVKDKVTNFMSNVIGFDLTKYTMIENSSSSQVTYPSEFNGLVAQESPSYKFEYNGQILDTMSIFYNGYLNAFKIFPTGDPVYYKFQQSDILNQAKEILQRYQTFVSQKYAADNSYITPMQNILSNLKDLSPQNITVGNINFQITKNEDRTLVQWLFSQNGVSTNWKKLEMAFVNGSFNSFRDTWIIYKVSEDSAISFEAAKTIALNAAQNYKFQIVHQESGAETTETIKAPDLSNARYDVTFTMVPYRNNTSPLYHESKLARDPLTLYPYWQFIFYMNESIAGNIGIQVSLWGDTEEIVYCHGYGFLGLPDSTPDGQDTNNPNNQTSETSDLIPLLVIIGLIVVLTASTSIVAIRYMKRQRKPNST